MNPKAVGLVLLAIACFTGARAAMGTSYDDPAGKKDADERFEKLLEQALKAPEKADWKALRAAFSKTSHYQPYSIEVIEKLKKISQAIGRGETKESEAELLKLAERERFMRLDTLAILMMLYEKTDQPDKAAKYQKLVEAILGVLDYPKEGTSFETAIQVLYIPEEYLVTTNMRVKGQSLAVEKGHRFDILEIEAMGDEPAKRVYFNIDLLSGGFSFDK
jgi:hypothetical protein